MTRSLLALALAVCTPLAAAQTVDVRAVARADGSVYVLHTADVAPGEGVTLTRTAGGATVTVTEAPVTPARNEAEARTRLGAEAEALLARTGEPTAFGAVMRLLADPVDAAVASALDPAVARALGRAVVDRSPPSGQRVAYRVDVVDGRGEPTGASGEVTLQVSLAPPPAVGGLAATHRGGVVSLRWAPSNDPETVGYHVFDGEVRLTERLVVRNEAASRDSVFATVAVEPGTRRLTVRAVDFAGELGAAGTPLVYEVTDNVPPAFVPNVAAFARADGEIEVTWPLSPAPDLAGYRVYRARGTSETDADVLLTPALVPPTETVYRDAVTAGSGARAWFYRVSAVDAAGNESPLSAAATAQVEDRTPPATPSGLTATWERGAVALAWTAPSIPDLETFVVERRRLTGGAARSRARVDVDAVLTTTLVDFGPTERGFLEGETYRFYVAAQDSARNVSPADSVDLTVPNVTPPAPPGNVRATSERGARVHLVWTPSPSLDVAAYRVTRDGAPPTDVQATEWRDDDVAPGRRYAYTVEAVDTAGNVSEPGTDELVFRDAAGPPPVRNVRARPGPGGVAVTWEPSPASDVTGYRVEHAAIRGGVYAALATADGTAWTHARGAEGGWYRVVALDASGHEGAPSEPARALGTGL